MKRIMQVMYDYHDGYNKFPMANGSRGGKPPMSWQIALLWYFDTKLANDYRADEQHGIANTTKG